MSSTTPARASSSSTASAAAPAPAPLTCQAQAASRRPRDHTTIAVRVHTAAYAHVTGAGPLAPVTKTGSAGRASGTGTRTLRFQVGDAVPGVPVVIAVLVRRDGQSGTCWAAIRPRAAQAAAVAAPAPPPAPASPPTAVSCYPLSNEGTCYEPGEFCRDSDHGVRGVAGDGEKIICTDNDGWRWEPV